MRKLLIGVLVLVAFVGCSSDTTQTGIVESVELSGVIPHYGYKYRVVVRKLNRKGNVCSDAYTLRTDKNYRVGDTVRVN